MFVIGNFLIAVATILDIILGLLLLLILVYVVISWLNADPYNPIVSFVNQCVEPLLRPLRSRIPRGPLDWSAFLASLIIIFTQILVVGSIRDFGYRLKANNRSSNYQFMQIQPVDREILSMREQITRA